MFRVYRVFNYFKHSITFFTLLLAVFLRIYIIKIGSNPAHPEQLMVQQKKKMFRVDVILVVKMVISPELSWSDFKNMRLSENGY